MGRRPTQWTLGQRIEARLVEKTGVTTWIASFNGQLIGVQNASGAQFKKGQRVELEVLQLKPLTFQRVGQPIKKLRHFRVSV